MFVMGRILRSFFGQRRSKYPFHPSHHKHLVSKAILPIISILFQKSFNKSGIATGVEPVFSIQCDSHVGYTFTFTTTISFLKNCNSLISKELQQKKCICNFQNHLKKQVACSDDLFKLCYQKNQYESARKKRTRFF